MQTTSPQISNKVNIDEEIKYLKDLLKQKIRTNAFSTKLYEKNITEIELLRLLARYHKDSAFPTDKIKPIVKKLVLKKSPINICFSFTNCRSQSKLKFSDDTMLPHYGWMYLVYLLSEIEQYGKLFYKSKKGNCFRFYILDETPIIQKILFNNKKYEKIYKINQLILKKWIKHFPVDIVIKNLKPTYFKINKEELKNIDISFDEIYCYATSLGLDRMDKNPILMDPLYMVREKNEAKIIELIGIDTWEIAREKATLISTYSRYRKENNLAKKIIKTSDYIDTSVLQSPNRFNLKTTFPALLDHGMPIIRKNHGSFWINVIPEYRIKRLYPDAKKILIDKSELTKKEKGLMTFFYITEMEPWENRIKKPPKFDDIIPPSLKYEDLN